MTLAAYYARVFFSTEISEGGDVKMQSKALRNLPEPELYVIYVGSRRPHKNT